MKRTLALVVLMLTVTACSDGNNQASLGQGVAQATNWEDMSLEATNTAAVSNGFLIQMR